METNTFDVSEVNRNVYTIDVSSVALTLALKGKTYLSTHRKMENMKYSIYDMSNSYFLAYTREEKDKHNYLYTFYLYNLPSTFSMDKFRKFFYQKLKTEEEINAFLEKPFEEVVNEWKKDGIGDSFFTNEKNYNKFKEEYHTLRNDNRFKHMKEAYPLSWLILFSAIWTNLSQYPFKDGVYEKQEILLKKKSEDKIISTYSNKLFHLAMYGEDMDVFSLK